MNSTYKDSIIITKENLLHTKIFNFNDEGKIKGIEIQKSGEQFVVLSAVLSDENLSLIHILLAKLLPHNLVMKMSKT